MSDAPNLQPRTEPLSLLQRFFRFGADRPAPSLMFLVAMSLAAAFGVARVTVDSGFDRLVPKDDAERQAYLRVAREFGSDHRSFVYLRDPQLWSPAKLQALEKLHEDLRQLPFVERVDDLFTQRTVKSVEGQLTARPLLGAIPADSAGTERARREALDDPVAARNIVSADGNAIAIGISIRERGEGPSEREVHETLEKVLASSRGQFATLVEVGPPRIDAEIREGLLHDMRVLVPASALLLGLTVFAFFRSLFAAVMPLLVAGLSLLWTFGMMGWAGIPVSILSAMLPSLVVVIGATEIMRMISGYYGGLLDARTRGAPADRVKATEFMLKSVGAPAVLTVLTTAIGFASNAFAGIAIIRDFGLAASFAILSNGIITVLLVPMLYASFGPRTGGLPAFAASGGFSAMAARAFGVLRSRLALWALALTAVLCVAFVQQASSLYVTNEPLTFFRPERAIVQDARRMQQDLAGVKVFYITLQSNTEGAFRDPANLQRLADIQGFIAKQRIFDRSLSLADVVSQANQEANSGRPESYRVPQTRKLVAEYLLLHPPRDLEPYVSHDFRRANIVVRHNVRDSSTLNHHIRELKEVVGHYAGADMATAVVGENLMINAAADRLLEGQAAALAGLLAVVFIVMSLMFTSVKGGIIALVPSVVPILMILGVMRILEIPLNAGTVMVAVIAIGIAIDGTIHLFARYSELCRSTSNYDEAVIETVKDEAAPVIAVSLALALGFGVLLLSDFTLIAQFGALAAATMLFSIFANLLITPLVMSKIRLVGLYEILAMSKQRAALEHSPLFKGMTGYQVRKAILISELLEYGKGDRLIEQGTMGRSMFLVVSGELEVVRIEPDGERLIAILGPGEVLGEIGFVQATRRTADVRAIGPVSVLRFDHERIEKDLVFFPHIMAKLNFNISGILGKRLADIVEARAHPAPQAAAPAAPGDKFGEDG
ncbi:MAG: MMPL family transporter [Proteobacteria bacterium]|nr:MMPL family transporter [Pseudomonadota bacterium]